MCYLDMEAEEKKEWAEAIRKGNCIIKNSKQLGHYNLGIYIKLHMYIFFK